MDWRAIVTGLALCGLAAGAGGAGDLEQRAVRAVERHRLVEARGLYRRLAAEQPHVLGHQVWVGRISSWLNDYATATVAFDRVLAADPHHVEALVGKAYVALWRDRFAEADTLLVRAAAVAPNDPQVQLAFARSYHFQGDDAAAARHVARALALDPGSADARELGRRLAPAPERPGLLARLRRLLTGRS